MNALVAADLVVIPVTPEYQPVVGAEQTWQTCGLVRAKLNPRLREPRFLLTQVDARLSRHERYATYMREKYGAAVLPTPIRTSSSLASTAHDGRTVFDVNPNVRGAVDYAAAARSTSWPSSRRRPTARPHRRPRPARTRRRPRRTRSARRPAPAGWTTLDQL